MSNKDVKVCKYYLEQNFYNEDGECSQGYSKRMCKDISDCYFKQLQHKEEELNQYKKSKQASYEQMQVEWNKVTWDNRKLEQENKRLREALEETRNYIVACECGLDTKKLISFLEQALKWE